MADNIIEAKEFDDQQRRSAGSFASLHVATQPESPEFLTTPADLPEHPFVWQHGYRLLLLDLDVRSWVFAELLFDDAKCRYVEVRRAAYESKREAFCALVSRAMKAGPEAAEDAAQSLDLWNRNA